MMHKSQFVKMYTYDWFCAPGSHMAFISQKTEILYPTMQWTSISRAMNKIKICMNEC